jgi:hypothetical protein
MDELGCSIWEAERMRCELPEGFIESVVAARHFRAAKGAIDRADATGEKLPMTSLIVRVRTIEHELVQESIARG